MSLPPIQDTDEATYSSQSYTRISIHLPTATTLEKTAAWYFLNSIELTYDGCTYSAVDDAVFVGKWVDKGSLTVAPLTALNPANPSAAVTYTDRICIAFVDVPTETRNLRYAEDVADNFWLEAKRCYGRFKSDQLAFWVYTSQIQVRVTDSPELTALKRSEFNA